jgi:formyltetrahydrofolate synthetase
VIALGGPGNGFPREDGFDIVVASEVMAIFCLATSLRDLKERLARIIVAYTRDRETDPRRDLQAHGAMAVLLKDALASRTWCRRWRTTRPSCTADRLPTSRTAATPSSPRRRP